MIITNNQIRPSGGNNIKVDNNTVIASSNRGVSFSSVDATLSPVSGDIIEGLWSLCDGSSHILTSGTYIVQNVSAPQTLSNTHADINGSVISYVPPPEATKVIYRFSYSHYWVTSGHGITHHKFLIDGVDVVHSRNNRSQNNYLEARFTFEWMIPIGGITDPNTGRQSTWTTPKTLKMQARNYSTGGNDGAMHGTYYWDGGSLNVFSMPIINILALR